MDVVLKEDITKQQLTQIKMFVKKKMFVISK